MHALTVSIFLRCHFYGRSRVPPLTALLQRQFRPLPPAPVRHGALLVQPPDWFETRVAELEEMKFVLALQMDREMAMGEEDD
jgi:hypothetical protein